MPRRGAAHAGRRRERDMCRDTAHPAILQTSLERQTVAELNDQDKAFLEELDREIAWEWKWEKRHRRWGWGINWTTWLARLLLLALSSYQANRPAAQSAQAWIPLSLAVLAMLNVALPLLAYTFRFQQRQEVHDGNAREYCVIRVQFLSGLLGLADAVNRFADIRRTPTEKTIRGTP